MKGRRCYRVAGGGGKAKLPDLCFEPESADSMNSTRLGLGVLALALLGAGCTKEDAIKKFTSDKEETIATGFIDKLRKRQVEEIESRLEGKLRAPGVRDTLMKMAEMIPAAEADSVTLVGAHSQFGDGGKVVNLTYQYQFGDRWFLINCATRGEGETLRIAGINVTSIPRSLEEEYRFTLAGKSAIQYTVLAAAILFPLLSLFALVKCARDKNLRRKWAWILFILLGVGRLTIDWTTAAWGFQPLSFLLFSSGAFANLYGPWTISVALPLGALLYLLSRRRNQNPALLSNPS